jgi:hypothetical protein
MSQRYCKHKFVSIPGRDSDKGYWFRCIYCGKEEFGRVASGQP